MLARNQVPAEPPFHIITFYYFWSRGINSLDIPLGFTAGNSAFIIIKSDELPIHNLFHSIYD